MSTSSSSSRPPERPGSRRPSDTTSQSSSSGNSRAGRQGGPPEPPFQPTTSRPPPQSQRTPPPQYLRSPPPQSHLNPLRREEPPHQRRSSAEPFRAHPRRGGPSIGRTNGFGKAPAAPPLPAPPVLVLPPAGPYRGPLRKGRTVVAISFGVLWRDGVFASELEVPLEDGHLEINKNRGYLVITGDGFGKDSSSTRPVRIVVSFDSIDSILTDSPNAFFTLTFAPTFETYTASIPAKIERVMAFSKEHQEVAPFASRHLRVKFGLRLELDKFSKEATSLSLPPPLARRVPVEQRRLYDPEHVFKFRGRLSVIDVRLAFQLEGILRDGRLSPQEILTLVDDGLAGIFYEEANEDKDPGRIVEAVLMEVRARLVAEQSERRIDNFPAYDGLPQPLPLPSSPFNLIELLQSSKAAVVLGSARLEVLRDENVIHCRHVAITPTSMYFEGPFVEASNAIVRRYPAGQDDFLRVSFVDEDRTKLQNSRWGVSPDFVRQLVLRPLLDGLDISGRDYKVLGYSQSSLKSHAVWLVAPFRGAEEGPAFELARDEDGDPIVLESICAADIRESFGNFDSIVFQPTLYGARLSQGFTSSRISCSLGKNQIVALGDIEECNELGVPTVNFSDGAGTMSIALRDQVWRALASDKPRDRDGTPPDVFQVCISGHKGIVVLDKGLPGFRIGLRESMRKFEGLHDDWHSRFAFLSLLRTAVDQVVNNRRDYVGARQLLAQYDLGRSLWLQRLITSFDDFGSLRDSLLVEEPFLRLLMNVAESAILKRFKTSMRLPLPGCYTLVGVPDQDKWLVENEIYACVAEVGKEPIWITGRVAITRSPTLDAGDVRIVQAVGRLADDVNTSFKSLRNCVVLPSVGNCSLASQMGGGDLDGDRYQIITIESLVPNREKEPRAHTSVPPRRLGRPCTIDDIAHSMVDFINNDVVGVIATTHLKIADSSPLHGYDKRCEKLADLHSRAVDFVKTGNVIKLEDVPKAEGKRPDFLKNDDDGAKDSDFYESQRALGVLYRAIPDPSIRLTEQDVLADADADRDSQSSNFLHLRRAVKSKLSSLLNFGSVDPTPIETTNASLVLNYFCATFVQLSTINNFPRRPGRHLSEAEAFLGTILARSRRDNQGRKESASALVQQTARLADTIEGALTKDVPPRDGLRALWASWSCALEQDERKFGIKSYRWMIAAMLLDSMARYEQVEPEPTPSSRNAVPPVIPPLTTPRRAPPPPLSHSPTTTRLPKKVPKAQKRADREHQARYYAQQLARYQNAVPGTGTSLSGGIGGASQAQTAGSSTEGSTTLHAGSESTAGWGDWGASPGEAGSSSGAGGGGSGSGRGAEGAVAKDPWAGW